jgi:Holliday junction resolvasome RuvABC endonuclease subunit
MGCAGSTPKEAPPKQPGTVVVRSKSEAAANARLEMLEQLEQAATQYEPEVVSFVEVFVRTQRRMHGLPL